MNDENQAPTNSGKQFYINLSLIVALLLILLTLLEQMSILALMCVLALIGGIIWFFISHTKEEHEPSFTEVAFDEKTNQIIDELTNDLNMCHIREGQFQALLEKLQTGLFLFVDNSCIYVNSYGLSILGKSDKEMNSLSESDIFTGDYLIEKTENDEEMQVTNGDKVSLFRIRRTEMSDNTYAIMLHPRKESKKVNIKKHKLEVIGQLASGVAHDFNNTLTGILGAADLLEEDIDESKQELISLIRESANRATDLTHKILNFSQKEYLDEEPFDLHEIIESTVSILERTITKKIAISSSLLASSSIVRGRKSLVQNMLLNMSLNSEAAMPYGGTLQFETHVVSLSKRDCFEGQSSLKPGTYIVLEIQDSGYGIPESELDKIFDPFYTTKDKEKSIGLGLTNAYKDVLSMGGDITVHSIPNEETTFSIHLPLDLSTENMVPHVDAKAVGEKTLLVVDDEKVIRLTAKAILENAGFTVLTASNGVEAIEQYKRNTVDLVLMDMIMPEMDGKDCLRELQKIQADVKVILVTGFVREKDVVSMKQSGLLNVVCKPFDPDNLINVIKATL